MISKTRQSVNILHTVYKLNSDEIRRLAGFTKDCELEHWSNHGKIY